jgi:hypothetical protein
LARFMQSPGASTLGVKMVATGNFDAPTRFTRHAQRRASARRISPALIDAVLVWGRELRLRGAWVYVVGRRDIWRAAREGVDVAALEGVHVVCSDDGAVLTVYRNRDPDLMRNHPGRRRTA